MTHLSGLDCTACEPQSEAEACPLRRDLFVAWTHEMAEACRAQDDARLGHSLRAGVEQLLCKHVGAARLADALRAYDLGVESVLGARECARHRADRLHVWLEVPQSLAALLYMTGRAHARWLRVQDG